MRRPFASPDPIPRRRRRVRCAPLVLAALLAGSCAPRPDGSDVAADRRGYAYQNLPRLDGAVDRDPDAGPGLAMRFTAGRGGATIASSDVPWRVPAECRARYRQWLQGREEPFGAQDAWLAAGACPSGPKRSFVGAAITGGGNKSAVYATEVLFELGRYGLADEIDVVSSVSGGSFAALHYALSCDLADPDCASGKPGWRRPVWDYADATRQMDENYFWPFVGTRFRPDNLVRNIATRHGSADDMAEVVSARLLHDAGAPLAFADLNPRRPNLILNATNVTRSRPDFDSGSQIPHRFQRPLSDDEALHFSFTQQYFWRLLSDLDRFPLRDALVASAAFPLLIDRPSLRHYRMADIEQLRTGGPKPSAPGAPPDPPTYTSLFDGGVRDNFGVTELQWLVQCQFAVDAKGAARGKLLQERACGGAGRRQPPDAVLVLGINSSLLRSNGADYEESKPRGWDSYVLPIRLSGTAESVNMIMAASGEMRKTQLRELLQALNPRTAPSGNPALARGPYQYLDIDIEATQILYCPDGTPVARDGGFTPEGPDWLLNVATGGSEASRCKGLQGVLAWNARRNLRLPTAEPGFCSDEHDCPELLPLVGQRRLLVRERAAPDGGDLPDLRKMFIGDDPRAAERLLSNRLLFDAVRETPTNFQLSPRYALLLRYVARWSVAHRVWQLCTRNPELVGKLRAGYDRVCKAPLPERPVDDRIGSRIYADAVR